MSLSTAFASLSQWFIVNEVVLGKRSVILPSSSGCTLCILTGRFPQASRHRRQTRRHSCSPSSATHERTFCSRSSSSRRTFNVCPASITMSDCDLRILSVASVSRPCGTPPAEYWLCSAKTLSSTAASSERTQHEAPPTNVKRNNESVEFEPMAVFSVAATTRPSSHYSLDSVCLSAMRSASNSSYFCSSRLRDFKRGPAPGQSIGSKSSPL